MIDKAKQQIPRPVRNQVAQPGKEVLVLRHQKLKKGEHQTFYEISRAGVWPWFEKIGARMVGQWRVIYPPPPACDRKERPDFDEILMMTRSPFQPFQNTPEIADAARGNGLWVGFEVKDFYGYITIVVAVFEGAEDGCKL